MSALQTCTESEREEIALALAKLRRTVTENPFIPVEPTEPQAVFLAVPEREVLYGGAAGGGKSVALLAAALQYVTVPRYSALLLRRTFADLSLPDALIPLSHHWLRGTPARWSEQRHEWGFPGGASLTFGYLETENDKYRYQGAQIQFCVARGTPILMADGSYRPVESLEAGDLVATLEGPRRVNRRMPPRVTSCMRLTAGGVSLTVSRDHRILTEAGWVCPLAQRPNESHVFCSTLARYRVSPRAGRRRFSYSSLDRRHRLEHGKRNHPETARRASGVCSADDRIGYAGFGDSRPEPSPPRAWYGRAVLLERAILQGRQSKTLETLDGARGRDGIWSATRGSHPDCLTYADCGDGQFRQSRAGGLGGTRVPDGAAGHSRSCLLEDDRGSTRERSQTGGFEFCHPYTMERRVSREGVRLLEVETCPAGEAEVFDLTVEGASHYVAWGGIISQNCGFDELTQFTESQYRYLFSRQRRLEGSEVPLRMRATSNPGGVGHEWVRQRFIDYRGHDRLFIPALLEDNPYLDADEYAASLEQLDPVTRAQLRHGDWAIQPAGNLFRREWLTDKYLDECPPLVRRVRYWDLAATEEGAGTDPDYTACCLMGQDAQGGFVTLDAQEFRATPAGVQDRVRAAADMDGREVEIFIEQEPGASGKSMIDHYQRTVLPGFAVYGVRSTGDKVTRFKPFSAAAQAGLVRVVRGSWVGKWLDRMLSFGLAGVHDDMADATSGAHGALTNGAEPWEGDDFKRAFNTRPEREPFADRWTEILRGNG